MPHDPITPLIGDVWWVHGSTRIGAGITFSRNMVIVREGEDLTLISAVRLDPAGEAALKELGTVRHVMRIGAHHGIDDRYYVDTFGAEFWCQEGSGHYAEPEPTEFLADGGLLPFADGEVVEFMGAKQPECAIVLRRGDGLLITCDSIQHYDSWSRCSLLAKVMVPFIGFKKGTLLGPKWLTEVTPEGGSLKADYLRLLQLPFANLIAGHGHPKVGGAKEAVRDAIQRTYPETA